MSFKAYWIIIPPRHNVILKSSEFPSEALLGSSAFGPGSEGWSHGTNGYDRELCGGKYGDVMRYKVVNPIYKWISYDNHPLNPSKIQSIMGYHMIIIDNTHIYIYILRIYLMNLKHWHLGCRNVFWIPIPANRVDKNVKPGFLGDA